MEHPILKLIQPFLGEGATAATYDPANLLILQDNNRNMKRTMDLLAMFDSDAFVSQRVVPGSGHGICSAGKSSCLTAVPTA